MITEEFLAQLSSSAPVPGGGGVSALVGSLAASLCAMVGNLTTGKKKYAEYQADIERLIAQAEACRDSLYEFIKKDAEAFEPLSRAYSIPKEDPERDIKLEAALVAAAEAPLALVNEIRGINQLLEELVVKGSRLAVSDVGVAATLTAAAAEGAAMNVYVNTKLMKNKEVAAEFNRKADEYVAEITKVSRSVYEQVLNQLKG